jgi:5'-methylthioadenosine phosphorylase
MIEAAERANVPVCRTGTYICTNGPRLETAAEIRAFGKWGADLVGMTLFPECSLAREKEICYMNVSVITNFGAGTTDQKLTSDEVVAEMQKVGEKLKRLMRNLPASYTDDRTCGCVNALKGTKISK